MIIDHDEWMSYGTIVNVSLVPKNVSTAEPIIGFMMTAYDQYGLNFGRFVEDQKYLLSVNCELSATVNRNAALMQAGPLLTKEVHVQWIAESRLKDEPQRINFYLTLELPDNTVWMKKNVAKIQVV